MSLAEGLDTTTPGIARDAGLLVIFAEFEREVLRERTRAGLEQIRQNRTGGAGDNCGTRGPRGPKAVPRRCSSKPRLPAG